MAINTNVYGTSEQWIDSSFNTYETNKNKVAYFGENQSRLINGVDSGKLSYSEPIDKSLAYCGLGRESALSHVGYIWNDENTTTYKVQEWQDRDITNFAFFQQNDGNISMDLVSENLDFTTPMSRRLFWQEMQTENNRNKWLQPYTSLNPNIFVLCIYVMAAVGNGSTSTIKCDLSTYMSTYKTTYPYVIQAYIVPYFSRGQSPTVSERTLNGYSTGAIDTNLRTLCYGQLDNYDPVGKDWNFYSYYFVNNCVFGFYNQAPFRNNVGRILSFIFATENAKEHCTLIGHGTNNYEKWGAIEYYDGIYDDIIKTVACFGLFFTDKEQVAKTGLNTNNDMYIGILDKNGVGHGEYLRGAETVNAPQNNYTDMHESGYDYTKDVDKTKYTNDTQFYTTWTSSAFTKMYVLRGSDVSSLANELYTAVAAAPSGEEIERYNQSVFLTQNPIDCIISLKKFPIEFFATSWQPVTPIKLGSYTCTTNGSPLPYTTGVYNFTFSNSANNGLYPWFDKSFLDYEPYTKCELTIPFCGTVEIPTTYLYDYDTIDVKLIVDFITGACTAYIQARNITIDSVSGNCAVTLPVNGLQSATLDSQIHSAATARDKSAITNGLGLIGGLAAVGIGIATGGIGTAVIGGIAALTSGANMIIQDKNIEYELQHMQVPMKQISGASGAINQSYDMRCKMRITRPKISDSYDAEVYANTIGFACLINTTVDTLSGLTVGDINLDNIDATDTEKQLIKNAFAGGVIL